MGTRSAENVSRTITLLLLFALGCASASPDGPSDSAAGGPDPVQASEAARPEGERGAADSSGHRGPRVASGASGPARFVPVLYREFQRDAAMETVVFADRYYRAPGNEGYEAVIDHLAERLRAGGFGEDPRLELRTIETEMDLPAWTPRSASLVLHESGVEDQVLHAFDSPEDRDRVMLPINAPSCDVTGQVYLHLDELEEGGVLVTNASLRQVVRRAHQRGAAAVLSASLASFNEDPTGRGRHLDAIQYRIFRPSPSMPVAQISPRSYQRIKRAFSGQRAPSVTLRAEVELHPDRPLRTLVAAIVGDERPDEAIAIASHVQEPGACDNASGVGGLGESALSLVRLLEQGELEWPDRTIVFLWGDEFSQSESWLESTHRTAIAGISSDMTGESPERTGAIALLERMPDPGAVHTLPPDEHTPWGAGAVDSDELEPNGFALIGRCAMVDVGTHVGGGWESADHPWEGGSDHDVFINRGIPGMLFWHFTDFSYHTSLDRLEMVDSEELRRTQVALLATALAVADPRPEDLERYLASLAMEETLRTRVAIENGDAELSEQWRHWCSGAAAWLEAHCNGGH